MVFYVKIPLIFRKEEIFMLNPLVDAVNFYKINNSYEKRKNVFSMYQVSNERLDLIFDKIDFVGKDVLSVMASGDQPILAYSAMRVKKNKLKIVEKTVL